MQRFIQSLCLMAGVTAISACAGLSTQLPDISKPALTAETQAQAKLALTTYQQDAKTLLDVAYPVLRDNADLCPNIRPDIGILMHRRADYDKRLREASGSVIGARDDLSVFQIAENSPAAKAGLRAGDILLGEDDAALSPYSKAFKARLVPGRQTELRVLRNGQTFTKIVEAIEVCDYRLRLKPSSTINAYADGRNITMTSGMMNFVESDDELALIVGHELAHNTLGHIRKILGNYIITLGATRYTRPFESEADYVGLYYLARAGYSPQGVEDFWRRLAKINPKSVGRAKSHPTFPDRYLRLSAARAEILEKQSRGEVLVPNFKSANK